jgi:hypothetical protein
MPLHRFISVLCALQFVASAAAAAQPLDQPDPTPLGLRLGVTTCAAAATLLDAELSHPDGLNQQDSDVQVGTPRHPKGIAPGVIEASFLCEAPRWVVVSLLVRYVKSEKGDDGDISFMDAAFDDLNSRYTLLVGEKFLGFGMEEAQFRSRNTYVRAVSSGKNGEFFSVNYMTDGWARQVVSDYTQEHGGRPRVVPGKPAKG